MKFAEILEHAQLAAHWEEIPGGVIPGTTRISPNRSRKKEQNPSLENPNRPPGQRTCHGLSPASHGEVGRLQPTTMKRWWCLIGEHAKGFPIAGTIYQGGWAFKNTNRTVFVVLCCFFPRSLAEVPALNTSSNICLNLASLAGFGDSRLESNFKLSWLKNCKQRHVWKCWNILNQGKIQKIL